MSDKNSIFLKSKNQYNRNLNIKKTAIDLAAQYLHLQTNRPINECLSFIEQETSYNGSFPLTPINLKILKRQPNQDRAKAIITIDNAIDYITETNSVISPNFNIYDNTNINRSCTGKYVEDKMAKRKVVKRMGLDAQQKGDMATFAYCNNSEYGIKILANSLSGAHASPYNALWNKTAHSALTSCTRVVVSYSNASTERFLEGNRHYHNKDIVVEALLSITYFTNYEALISVINKYNLYIPTIEDVIKLINRCTKFYWINKEWDLEISDLVSKLNPYQRAAFVYTGDLYHVGKYNSDLVKTFLTTMITRPKIKQDIDADNIIKNAGRGIAELASILCSDILAGSTVSDIKDMSIEVYNKYANTIDHVLNTLNQYSDLLTGLFVTESVPSSIFTFPNSIRRSVVGSDTDSTMFTTQSWIEWYFGKLTFNHEADKLANTLCFLNTQIISHILAVTSRQIGVIDANLYKLEMKNEYGFPVYIRANRAKHYATLLASREGNVYKIPKNDIKGVGLKDSKIPRNIMSRLEKEINNIMMTIISGKTVDIHPLMSRIANTEWLIKESLDAGKIDYLSTANISPINSYKKPMASKYMHYDLWVNVFQKKFGIIEEPPYRVIKVSTTLVNTTETIKWINGLDPVLKDAMMNWIDTYKPTQVVSGIDAKGIPKMVKKDISFSQLLLPLELFEGGIPTEFLSIINKRKIIAELMGGSYILLEMLGFYIKNNNYSIFLSDDLPHRKEYGYLGDSV